MKTRRSASAVSGFSLVEVVMALGVVSFCILSLLGLLAVGLQSDTASESETAVTGILTALVGDMASAPAGQPSKRFGINVDTLTGTHAIFFKADGSPTGAVDAAPVTGTPVTSSLYRATLIVTPPGAGAKGATQVRILLTWPALSDKVPTSAPTKYTGSVQTLTAFLRN